MVSVAMTRHQNRLPRTPSAVEGRTDGAAMFQDHCSFVCSFCSVSYFLPRWLQLLSYWRCKNPEVGRSFCSVPTFPYNLDEQPDYRQINTFPYQLEEQPDSHPINTFRYNLDDNPILAH